MSEKLCGIISKVMDIPIDEITETKNVSDIKKYLKIHGIDLND